MNDLIKLILLTFCFASLGCETSDEINANENKVEEVNNLMNSWHKSAATANYEKYFDVMENQSVFIGTDAGENWTKEEFQSYSKPHFKKGKAWSFKAIERNIYFSETGNIAWFDELLDTWMGTCRGSGVLEKTDGSWEIKHYVLSVCIPNDDMEEVIMIKSVNDSLFREAFNSQ